MIANQIVNDLVDYALGIERGLYSNGRKNRGSHQMENFVKKYIVAVGFKKNANYFKEMYLKYIDKLNGILIYQHSLIRVKQAKRFDFMIKTNKMIYVISSSMTDELYFWQLIMNGILSFAYTIMESVSGSYIPNK